MKSPTSAPKPGSRAERCPGSYYPQLGCDAISANADADQARNSERQTWWFRWEVLLTFGTLVVAAFAMEFARQAAKHNRRSADAAEQSDRPHLLPSNISISDPAAPDLNGELDFTFNFINHGKGPGWVKRYAMAFETGPEVTAVQKLDYLSENAAVSPRGGWGTAKPLKVKFPPETLENVIAGTEQMVLFCALEYIDANGGEHVHKFAQLYLVEHKTFRPIDLPFWEYT